MTLGVRPQDGVGDGESFTISWPWEPVDHFVPKLPYASMDLSPSLEQGLFNLSMLWVQLVPLTPQGQPFHLI